MTSTKFLSYKQTSSTTNHLDPKESSKPEPCQPKSNYQHIISSANPLAMLLQGLLRSKPQQF